MKQFNSIYNKVCKYSEMTKSECEFLYNAVLEKKPKKILEVGVSSGASSALLLDASFDCGAILYSVDLATKYYKDNSKNVGFILKEQNYFNKYLDNYKLFTGGTIADFIEEIGSDIDFVLLDASHGLPGEVLDFLTILPYCKKDTVFIVHDVNIQTVNSKPTQSNAPKWLILSVDGIKTYPKFSEHMIYNIAKLELTNMTYKNIINVFSALLSRWVRPMTKEQIDKFINVLSKHYDNELINYLRIASNKFRYEEKPITRKQKIIKSIIKFLQKYI